MVKVKMIGLVAGFVFVSGTVGYFLGAKASDSKTEALTLKFEELLEKNEAEAKAKAKAKRKSLPKCIVLDENDSIQILRNLEIPARNAYDHAVYSLWVRNKNNETESKILQTAWPDHNYHYFGNSKRMTDYPIDSIGMIISANIVDYKPLKLVVEHCPDSRNIYSYVIDAEKCNAKFVPSNSGFMGVTEEGYMVFRSFRYVGDPDVGGRYTLIEIFNEDGYRIDSLSLKKHVRRLGFSS